MATYSSTDLQRKSGEVLDRALQMPVTITKRNRPTHVVLSAEAYDRLTQDRGGKQQAFNPDTITDEVMAQLERAAEEILNDED